MTKSTTYLPAIELGDEADLGPAMRALNPQRRAFVVGKVHYGLNNTDAYRAAGYSPKSANKDACQIANREDVQAAIIEESRKVLISEGPRSIRTMVEIRDNTSIKPEIRLKAATEIANRSGLHAVTEHHEHQHHHLSEAEQDRRILALCAELGMTPDEARKMLIAPADMQRNAEGVYELAPPPPRELSQTPDAGRMRNLRRRRKGMTSEEVTVDQQRMREMQAERGRRLYREAQAAMAVEEIEPDNPDFEPPE